MDFECRGIKSSEKYQDQYASCKCTELLVASAFLAKKVIETKNLPCYLPIALNRTILNSALAHSRCQVARVRVAHSPTTPVHIRQEAGRDLHPHRQPWLSQL